MKQHRYKFKIIMLLTSFFVLKAVHVIFASENKVDPREMAVDLAIGGMKEGSHILAPKNASGITETPKIFGSTLDPKVNTGIPNSGAIVGNQTGNGANLGTNEGTEPHESGGSTVEGGNTEIPTTTPEIAENGATDNNIITVDADVNLSEDDVNVDANLAIDPDAGGALLDADATASTDTVNQELTSEAGLLVDVGHNTTGAEIITIGTENGTGIVAPVGEVEAGLEADIEATGSGDVTTDPADGLP